MPLAALLALYALLLLGVCFYAARFGDRPERIGAAIIAAGSLLTAAVSFSVNTDYRSVDLGLLVVDIVAWVLLLRLALSSNRYWPLWATAFHSIALLTHLAMFVDPSIVPEAYAHGQGLWAYPMLAALLAGAERCRRMRQAGAPASPR